LKEKIYEKPCEDSTAARTIGGFGFADLSADRQAHKIADPKKSKELFFQAFFALINLMQIECTK